MAKEVKRKEHSCAFCVHRSECWGSEAYSDYDRGKKPYPSNVKCTTRFKFDKQLRTY